MKMTEPVRARKRLDFRPAKGLKSEPLAEPLQMRELYVRGIRHDINNLVSPMLSMSDFYGSIDEGTAVNNIKRMQEFHRSSKIALEQVAKLSGLMASFQSGKPVDVRFDPGDEIKRAVLSFTFNNGSARIGVSLSHQHPVQGNPLELYRAFMNLLVNAHEALGAQGEISIASRDMSLDKLPFVSIAFADNGHGMDQEMLETAFQAGITTKPTGKGLGLFVVQHSVASFGGLIEAESEIGSGTKFTLFIPATI
jgi:signal transduction histidine kinase